MTDPADLSAVEARRLIGSKDLSPVELLDACIARIDRCNGAINAIVARDDARAREAAKAAEKAVLDGDALGPLHGLPLGVKDLTETAGLRTTWGSLLFKDHVPARDDPIIARLRRAGAIVLGKTNTPEFGAGAVTTNPVHGMTGNPHDPAKTSSGSSGGSAAALAAGMVALATGSDFGGSLRTPAAFCGVAGFRPSPGSVPDSRKLRGWSPLSVEGPMARTATDAALLFAQMVGEDPGDPIARNLAPGDIWPLPAVDLGRLRVGITTDLGFHPVDPRIRDTFAARTAALKAAFRSMAEVEPPMDRAHETFETLRGAAFIGAHAERVDKAPHLVGPRIHENVRLGRTLTLAQVVEAEKAQTRLFRSFQSLFNDIDLLICPTVAVPPFDKATEYVAEIDGVRMRTYIEWVGLTWGLTLTASPVVSIPCGRDPTGMPFGIQVCGPKGADRFVLAAAAALETWMSGRPELARPLPDLARGLNG